MNNRYMVLNLNGFVKDPPLTIVEDGVATTLPVHYEALSDKILQLSKDYEISNVNIVGAQSLAEGIKKQIQEKEMKEYAKNILDITVINKF